MPDLSFMVSLQTAVAVPIQVPVAASSAPVLVEQKATTKEEPELSTCAATTVIVICIPRDSIGHVTLCFPDDAIPAQGTVPMESDADSVADAPESRFAQQVLLSLISYPHSV